MAKSMLAIQSLPANQSPCREHEVIGNFCTVITASHLSFAYALAASLGPSARLHLTVCDADLPSDKPANVCLHHIDDVCDSAAGRKLSRRYCRGSDQFRWSTKPLLILYLLERQNVDAAVWVDCDVQFYADWAFLFEQLASCGILLTPHWKPFHKLDADPHIPYDEYFQYGVYNAGFVGASRRGIAALQWWCDACLQLCQKDVSRGLYVDQTHLNLLPAYFDNVCSLRHKGCNVAHWNVVECPRCVNGDEVVVGDNEKLVFIHYALPAPDRFLYGQDPLLLPYFLKYAHRLVSCGLRDVCLLCKDPVNRFCLELALFHAADDAITVFTDFVELDQRLRRVGVNAEIIMVENDTALQETSHAGSTYATLFHVDQDVKIRIAAQKWGAPLLHANWRLKGVGHPAQVCTARFETTLRHLAERGLWRVMLFGGGQHTGKLFSRPLQMHGVRLVGVVDESAASRSFNVGGLGMFSPQQAAEQLFDAIVISSDMFQHDLRQRAMALFPDKPVFTIHAEVLRNEPRECEV